jgi:lipoprotein-releasing system permease protein
VKPAAAFSRWEWMLARRYLGSKRKQGGVATIALISFFCIMIAIMVLTVSMAIFNGFRSELLGKLLSVNGHVLIHGEPLREQNRAAVVNRLRTLPTVARVTPMVQSMVLASGNGQRMVGQVRAVLPEDLRSTPIVAGNIRAGSMAGFGEGEDGGDLVLVGQGMATALGVGPGDYLTLLSPDGASTAMGSAPVSKTYTIGGVFEVGMTQIDDAVIYMPLAQGQLFFNRGSDVDVIEVMAKNPDDLDHVTPVVRKASGPGAMVEDWRDADNAFWGALQMERSMVRLIMMALVLIAAMTIISGVVMLVKNKERDIAILRTMGASRGAMTRVFIIAGASIGILAVPCGVGLALLFCHYIEPIQNGLDWITHTQVFNPKVYYLSHLPAKIDWSEVAWTSGFTILVSVLVTIIPSWRAARIDPVEALRYE